MKELLTRLIRDLEEFKDGVIDWQDFETIMKKHHLHWDNGASRFCIYLDTENYVLKIPRKRHKDSFDYCTVELDVYEKAKIKKIENLFLPLEKVATLSTGLTIYKQQKFTCDWSEYVYGSYADDWANNLEMEFRLQPKRKRELIYLLKDSFYCGSTIDITWLYWTCKTYGYWFCRRFAKWTRDNKINDLHNNNIGVLNDKPIIIDYAGYHG